MSANEKHNGQAPSPVMTLSLREKPGGERIVLGRGEERCIYVHDFDALNAISAEVGENSRLSLYVLEGVGSAELQNLDIEVRQGADSRVSVFVGMAGAIDRVANRVEVHLDAPGAEFRLDGLAVLNPGQHGALKVTVHHHVPHCTSNQDVKFLVGDGALGVFDGLIKVMEGASGTEAFQNNRNLLTSANARMTAQPQLEIYCDDVKCSHGSATGQLDEQALFYMRSRGIDLPEARSMLMNAFVADVIDRIDSDVVRDEVRGHVDNVLAKL